MSNVRQEREERDVFVRFVESFDSDVDLRSVEARRPPEPDILCRVAGEPRAFELVELVDADAVRRHRRQVEMQVRLLDVCEALGPIERFELQRRAGNASVSLAFTERASARARELAVPRIMDFLCRIDPQFVGDAEPLPWWDGVVDEMRIMRPGIIGPVFSVAAAGYSRNPMVARVEAKFQQAVSERSADRVAGVPPFPSPAATAAALARPAHAIPSRAFGRIAVSARLGFRLSRSPNRSGVSLRRTEIVCELPLA